MTEAAVGNPTAKLSTTRRGQTVMLPKEFSFEGSEVFVRRDLKTGDVILSGKPNSWDGLFSLYGQDDGSEDYMGSADRDKQPHNRDPFKDR